MNFCFVHINLVSGFVSVPLRHRFQMKFLEFIVDGRLALYVHKRMFFRECWQSSTNLEISYGLRRYIQGLKFSDVGILEFLPFVLHGIWFLTEVTIYRQIRQLEYSSTFCILEFLLYQWNITGKLFFNFPLSFLKKCCVVFVVVFEFVFVRF
jgi:hypothetical protein